MHILTFDIEDWFHLLENESTKTEDQWSRFEPRIHRNTDRILQLLCGANVKATFFCLGWIAKAHPDVIKTIQAAGHEIASHSYSHQLAHGQTLEQFRQDLTRSIAVLEDLVGTKVRAYRAPGFSITPQNPWAFTVLAENGIEIDSSVFVSTHAHGGFADFGLAEPALIEHDGIKLKEFPIGTGRIAGRQIIFSGGGYFRLLPGPLIRQMMRDSRYSMTYFHPRDFDADQPLVPGLPWYRIFKSYVGLSSSFKKLKGLLDEFEFVDVATANDAINWESRPTIRLGESTNRTSGSSFYRRDESRYAYVAARNNPAISCQAANERTLAR
jgi:polysaccharide deacetylase family protein (PEP-CTERM system associated)